VGPSDVSGHVMTDGNGYDGRGHRSNGKGGTITGESYRYLPLFIVPYRYLPFG